jgi:hypothetical protein
MISSAFLSIFRVLDWSGGVFPISVSNLGWVSGNEREVLPSGYLEISKRGIQPQMNVNARR